MLPKPISVPTLPWPHLLVVVNRPSTQALAASLRLTSLAMATVTTAHSAAHLLKRRKVELLVVDPADLSRLAPLPPTIRAILLASPEEGGDHGDVRSAVASMPPDPRKLVAEILILANDHPAVDNAPEVIDELLSVIRPLGLFFVRYRPVPMRPTDRALAELLSREPGRVLAWETVTAALGCSRNAAYAAADRIREALADAMPDHIYVQTVRGEGLFWAARVASPEPLQSAPRVIVPANSRY
jgi:hypothetical protein